MNPHETSVNLKAYEKPKKDQRENRIQFPASNQQKQKRFT